MLKVAFEGLKFNFYHSLVNALGALLFHMQSFADPFFYFHPINPLQGSQEPHEIGRSHVKHFSLMGKRTNTLQLKLNIGTLR